MKHLVIGISTSKRQSSGVIFVKNSISTISIFLKAYIDIIDKISIFSKSSQSPRCIQAQEYSSFSFLCNVMKISKSHFNFEYGFSDRIINSIFGHGMET